MVGGVRGSHIVLPRFAGAPDAAVYTEAVDARPIFVIPWNEQVLVGTTEVPDSGDPSKTQPSSDEIEYLLRSLPSTLSAGEVGRPATYVTVFPAYVRCLSHLRRSLPQLRANTIFTITAMTAHRR